jgi:hypothetical protein
MDGTAAINHNLEALKRILAGMVAMAGLGDAALTSPQDPGPGEVDAKRRVGVAMLKRPPPGGLTTADLPSRGRWG